MSKNTNNNSIVELIAILKSSTPAEICYYLGILFESQESEQIGLGLKAAETISIDAFTDNEKCIFYNLGRKS